jgi:hypothetical protein
VMNGRETEAPPDPNPQIDQLLQQRIADAPTRSRCPRTQAATKRTGFVPNRNSTPSDPRPSDKHSAAWQTRAGQWPGSLCPVVAVDSCPGQARRIPSDDATAGWASHQLGSVGSAEMSFEVRPCADSTEF